MASSRYVVGRADELADGESKIVVVNNRSIGIFNLGGKYYGLLNNCPHRNAELCKGRLQSNISSDTPGQYEYDPSERMLACPWHGWMFDITTGQSYVDPKGVRTRPFQVEVADGQTVITGVESGDLCYTPSEYVQAVRDLTPDATGRVPGPYQAETVEILVEDEYLIVNLRPQRPPRRPRPADASRAAVPSTDATTASKETA